MLEDKTPTELDTENPSVLNSAKIKTYVQAGLILASFVGLL
jgi:hypothetical protein